MFYLSEFFKIIRKNLVLGIIFFIGIFGVISLSHFHSDIKQELSLENKIHNFPYFNALLRKDVKIETIQSRMRKLPGVLSVELRHKNNLKKEVMNLKKVFGQDVIQGLSSVNYKKIKIELEKGLKTKSHTLIKEYLARLVGKKDITIGNIKTPNQIKLKEKSYLFKLLEFADTYALILLFCFWLVATILLLGPIGRKSFIIEKFQRKKYVYSKIYFSGLAPVICISLMINLFVKPRFELGSLLVIITLVASSVVVTAMLRKLKISSYV